MHATGLPTLGNAVADVSDGLDGDEGGLASEAQDAVRADMQEADATLDGVDQQVVYRAELGSAGGAGAATRPTNGGRGCGWWSWLRSPRLACTRA